MGLLTILLRAAYGHGRLTLDEADRLYTWLVLVLCGVIGLILLGLLMNLAGWGSGALALAFVFGLSTAIAWLKPSRVALVAMTGAIAGGLMAGKAGAKSMAVRFVQGYVDLLGKLLLCGAMALVVFGLVPLGGHFWAGFGVVIGAVVLALIIWQRKISAATLIVGALVAAGPLFLMYKGGLLMPEAWLSHSPSFTTMGRWGWQRWLVMFMFGGVTIFAIGHFWGKDAKKQAIPIVLGVIALFLVVPIVVNAPWVRWIGYEVFNLPEYPSITPSDAQVPLAEGPADTWAQGVLEPHALGMLYPELKLTRVWFSGSGFTVHCLYQTGMPDRISPYKDHCPDDPQIYAARPVNLTGEKNYFGYGYKL